VDVGDLHWTGVAVHMFQFV